MSIHATDFKTSKLIKKIMERIAEKREYYYLNDDVYDGIAVDALDFACDVIEEEVKTYNNGWIPCDMKLPDENGEYDVTVKCKYHPHDVTKYKTMRTFFIDGCWLSLFEVVAWQLLSAPYQPED